MKSIFKATAILGSSSVISVIAGLISAKFLAQMIGPDGIGYLAMMQGFLGLAAMIAGLGIAAGTVKTIAKAVADNDENSVASNQKAAIALSLISGLTALLLVFIFSDFINRLMLDGQGERYEIFLLGIALVFTLQASCFTGILNAHHNIKALAQIAVANTVLNAGFLIFFVWIFAVKGLIFGIVAGAVCNFLISFFFYRKKIPSVKIKIPFDELIINSKSLIKFGVPFTASLAVGSGVQMLLPLLILHNLDLQNVGFFRAASTISMMSLSVILTAMAQDYYPRLSKISGDGKLINSAVNEQLTFALLIFIPLILWLLFFAPYLVLFLYSAQFSQTAEILSIMLIGDIFKLLGWVLGFVILARSRSGLYFFSELTFGIILLGVSFFGIRYFGVNGVGIGYTAGYFCYFLAIGYAVKREISVRFSVINKFLIFFALISAVSVFALLNYFPANLNSYISIGFCLTGTLISIIYFLRQIPGERAGKFE